MTARDVAAPTTAREAAPTVESLRERVARAIWTDGLSPSNRKPWPELMESTRDTYRRMADAALAVVATTDGDTK